MDEKALFRVSLACAIAGIIALFVLSETLCSGATGIGGITKDKIGEIVRITGSVTALKEKGGVMTMKVSDNSSAIDVVVFDSAAMHRDYGNLTAGMKVEVKGRVSEWKGMIQVTADSVTAY